MMQVRRCSICGKLVPPGKGRYFADKDGKIMVFCLDDANKTKQNEKTNGQITSRRIIILAVIAVIVILVILGLSSTPTP